LHNRSVSCNYYLKTNSIANFRKELQETSKNIKFISYICSLNHKDMKKLIISILLCFVGMTVNAQLFTKIRYYDKFDDIVKEETHKTLITRTDSTFIIEEKGREPKVYYILNISTLGTEGDSDNIVNLVNNVYGYQTTWCVIRNEEKEQYWQYFRKVYESEERDFTLLSKYWLFLTNRVISKFKYSFEYDGEYFWIQNETPEDNRLGKDVNRIIYIK